MAKAYLVVLLAVLAAGSAKPYIPGAGSLYPGAIPFGSVLPAAYTAPPVPAVPAVPSLPAGLSGYAGYPYGYYTFAYGSSVSIPEVPVVNPAVPSNLAYTSAYTSLGYPALDYFYSR